VNSDRSVGKIIGTVSPLTQPCMKWMAIVNSRSVVNRARLLETLCAVTSEVYFTRYPGHALELARRATNGYDGIIAVGGDGTVHEILRHLHLQTQRLIILPAGTGNSLAKDVGLRPAPSLSPIPDVGHFNAVDLMRITCYTSDGAKFDCYSSSTVAVGYPARATQLANRYFKKLKGHCYSAASVISLLLRSRMTCTVQWDGGKPEEKICYGLLISNTRHMGNFVCFPEAVPDDGLVNVMELTASALPQLVHNVSVLSKANFYNPSRTYHFRTASVQLPKPGLLMVDGEVYANVQAVEIEVLPQVLRVLAGPI
jgi:diacylglycerol kinase (ATP)